MDTHRVMHYTVYDLVQTIRQTEQKKKLKKNTLVLQISEHTS